MKPHSLPVPRATGFCLALALLLLAAPLHAGGPDKSGVKPNVLSLPTGAGSIEAKITAVAGGKK